jgi:hypothetical protein
MGGSSFFVSGMGKDVNEAFRNEVDDAQYEKGHGGYTGTIGEKHGFVLFTPPAGMTAVAFCRAVATGEIPADATPLTVRTIREAEDVYSDKWGPCVAVEFTASEYEAAKAKARERAERDRAEREKYARSGITLIIPEEPEDRRYFYFCGVASS